MTDADRRYQDEATRAIIEQYNTRFEAALHKIDRLQSALASSTDAEQAVRTELTNVRASTSWRLGSWLVRLIPRRRREPTGHDATLPPWTLPTIAARHLRPVIFVLPGLVRHGGAERYVRALAQTAIDDGREVVFIATSRLGDIEGREAFTTLSPHVYVIGTDIPADRGLEFVVSVLKQLARPILVTCGTQGIAEQVSQMRAEVPQLKIIDLQFNHVDQLADNLRNASYIDLTVTDSNRLMRLLIEHLGHSGRVECIRFAGAPVESAPDPAIADVAWRRDLPLIGFVGRLAVEKRPLWFVELARRLSTLADFVVVGTGPLEAIVEEAGADIAALHMIGAVADGASVIAACDLLVIPSLFEGVPQVAVEARSAGVPIIATNVGGIAEVVEQNLSGILVDPGDFGALEAAVRSFLHDETLAERLREGARRKLPIEFTASSARESWRSILAQIDQTPPV